MPWIARKVGLRITDATVEKFYVDLCRSNVLVRESYKVKENDILQLFMRLREARQLTMEELTTACYSFVKHGMEPCTSVMTFCLYELAKNVSIQKRLRDEISHNLEDTDGQLTYDVIMSMNYLDQVVNGSSSFTKIPQNLQPLPSFLFQKPCASTRQWTLSIVDLASLAITSPRERFL